MHFDFMALAPQAACVTFSVLALGALVRWRGFWQLCTFLLVAAEVIGGIMMADTGPVTLSRLMQPLGWGAAAIVTMWALRWLLLYDDNYI